MFVAKPKTYIMQAMAQSVRGLRQSAALCGQEELPLTMDFLQGSEAVAAVLCRCVGPRWLVRACVLLFVCVVACCVLRVLRVSVCVRVR